MCDHVKLIGTQFPKIAYAITIILRIALGKLTKTQFCTWVSFLKANLKFVLA